MHRAAALIFACMCSASVESHRSKWLREMSPPKSPWALDWMAESNSDMSYIFQEPKHRISPIIFPNSNPVMNAWERQEAYDRVLPTAPRDHELLFPSQALLGLGGWVAPPYNRSLADFERATDIISSHFTPDAYSDKDSQKFRYIVIVAVINGLAENVARNGMKSYWDNYTTLARNNIENAVMTMQMSAQKLSCLMNIVKKYITDVKTIINNPTIQFVCRAQPSACDTAIYTAIHVFNDKALGREADVLLSLGTVAKMYLYSFEPVFEAMSAQNAYLYLMKSRDQLANLVNESAAARNKLERYGVKLQCLLNNP